MRKIIFFVVSFYSFYREEEDGKIECGQADASFGRMWQW